jgi:capsular polysaccharide transport system permease protein
MIKLIGNNLKKLVVFNKNTSLIVVEKVNWIRRILWKLKPSRKNQLFYSTAGLCTFVSILYFCFIASNVYISETKFVVRTADKKSSGPLFGEVLQQMGFTESNSDSWVVHDYMLSHDVMKQLNELVQIRQLYSDSRIDVFNRFPGIRFWDRSLEAFHAYYQDHVLVTIDPLSSIITLKVKGFSPEAVLAINKQLLDLSEGLINTLNERAQSDLIKTAQKEIKIATKYIAEVSSRISKLRQHTHLSDPEGQALLLQRLSVEKSLSDKQLAMAMTSLQNAQADALKQQLYIVRITNPTLPDAALEPRKIQGVFSMILFGLLLWGVLSLLVSGVREHYS